MCLWVEKAHIQKLMDDVDKVLTHLRTVAPSRARDLLFDLPPTAVIPAIIFRDFPKRHGNIIQKAVGLALDNHPGGYKATSATFTFLSGLTAEVDNFFMASDGQIHLFETKRDQKKIREEGVAGRNLREVKNLIESEVLRRTQRPLRYPIKLAYFSYADETFGGRPKAHQVNIGPKAMPTLIDMPIYSREDMNNLIGPCFGQFLRVIDRAIDTAIAVAVPELANKQRLSDTDAVQSLVDDLLTRDQNKRVQIGEPASPRSLTDEHVLSPATSQG